MNFANWSEFFAMGGYALYVWLSYGLSFLVLAIIMLGPAVRHRHIKRELERERRRLERAKKPDESSKT